MTTLRAVFLADSQLGMYATFSGMSDDDVAAYAARGMRVRKVPPVTGHEWDAGQYIRAVAAVNALRPDVVLFGGDMIDDPNRGDQLDDFLRLSAAIDRDIPVHWAPGNHDAAPDTVVPTRESLAAYREVFGPDYYTVEVGPVRLVVLNTVVIDHPELVPDEWQAQRDFLEEVLVPGDRETIVVGHHPLFVDRPDEPDTYWNLPGERRGPLLGQIHRAGVRLVLAGHWHRNGIARDGDLEMVVSGPVGYPLGDDPSGFRIVEFAEGKRPQHRYLPLD